MNHESPISFCLTLFLLSVTCVAESAYSQDEFPSLSIPGLDLSDAEDIGGTPKPPIVEDSKRHYPTPSRGRHSARRPIVSTPPEEGDFSLSIRTSLLNRFVEDQRVESNNVATRVLEADVRGVQTTATFVQLQSIESPGIARLNVVAQGTVNSNTVGFTPQARITTAGNHTFNVVKPVFFDGQKFMTKPAYGSLQVRQTPQYVNTMASGMPLIGPLGDQIAWNEVLRRMPASDAIVVRHVADDVFPKINRAVDGELRDLNRKWSALQKRLRALSVGDTVNWEAESAPDSFTTVVTNTSISGRTHDPSGQLSKGLAPEEAVAMLVSEDSVNHVLGKQPLSGLTVTDTTLQQLVVELKNGPGGAGKLQQVLATLKDSTTDPLLFSLRFADTRPLGLSFRDGRLQIESRFRILPKSGEPSITQLMKVQLKGRSKADGGWAMYVSDIEVVPASINEQPDSWTTLINTQLGRVVDLIPQTELPRTINLAQYVPKLPPLRIHRIQALGGHLRVSLRTEDSPQVTSRRPVR